MTKSALILWTVFLGVVLSISFLGISGSEGTMSVGVNDLWTTKEDHKLGIIHLSDPSLDTAFQGRDQLPTWEHIHVGFPFRSLYVDRDVEYYYWTARVDLFRATLNCAVTVALSGLIMAPFWMSRSCGKTGAIAGDNDAYSEVFMIRQNNGIIRRAILLFLLGSTVIYLIGWVIVLPWIWHSWENEIEDIQEFGFNSMLVLAFVLALFSCANFSCNRTLAVLGFIMSLLCLVMIWTIAGAGII